MDISGLTSGYLDYTGALAGTNADKRANSISSLEDKDLKNATDDELMEVCKEFESYFMEMIMKKMMDTTSILGEDSSASNSALVNYFKDTAITDLASTATEQNSLGLAQTLYEQMRRNYGLDASSVTDSAEKKENLSTEKATEIVEESTEK